MPCSSLQPYQQNSEFNFPGNCLFLLAPVDVLDVLVRLTILLLSGKKNPRVNDLLL